MIGKDPRPSEEHSRQARHYCDILLPALREVARQCGYAIAVHGSLERDIDLIAIPWRENEMTTEYLIEKLHGVVQAVLGPVTLDDAAKKPHGRKALTMRFCGHHYIDLSVMPPVKKTEQST
jgi:hypothetical protein